MKENRVRADQLADDFFPVRDVDYIEIYTGNAKQACHFFCTAFGFQPLAYSGLETGNRETASYCLKQRNIRIVLTGSYTEDSPVAQSVKKHGDGVKDIALLVDDV
ncbi:MAG: VOC family protein, partial [Bacillus sp. (in: firmicutes)]